MKLITLLQQKYDIIVLSLQLSYKQNTFIILFGVMEEMWDGLAHLECSFNKSPGSFEQYKNHLKNIGRGTKTGQWWFPLGKKR